MWLGNCHIYKRVVCNSLLRFVKENMRTYFSSHVWHHVLGRKLLLQEAEGCKEGKEKGKTRDACSQRWVFSHYSNPPWCPLTPFFHCSILTEQIVHTPALFTVSREIQTGRWLKSAFALIMATSIPLQSTLAGFGPCKSVGQDKRSKGRAEEGENPRCDVIGSEFRSVCTSQIEFQQRSRVMLRGDLLW